MLATLIKTRREALHLTQEELALAAHTTQATISRIEAGEKLPSPPVLFGIAQALGLEPGRLLELAATVNHQTNAADTDGIR